MRRMLLITNNNIFNGIEHPRLTVVAEVASAGGPRSAASSLDVVLAARDKVHLGWELAHHPLYGNIRPRLQPFRTILLLEPDTSAGSVPAPDLFSLRLISEAVSVYEAERDFLAMADAVPESLRRDCAFLDAELMKETLTQAGVPVPRSLDRN